MDLMVIGDIHGCLDKLNELLDKHWNPETEKLVFLGDLIDRGPDSYGVLQKVMMLQEQYDAIVLKENHEELFLSWLDDFKNETALYFPLGGDRTVNSFFDGNVAHSPYVANLVEMLKSRFSKEIEFMENLPNYYVQDGYLFVHAGVSLVLEDWRNTSDADFRWIRNPFHHMKNETGLTIVFGHTPTRNLNFDKSDDVWISPCATKIGIDGGAVFGGKLHGLKLSSENEPTVVSV